jgi:hypothetical protein
MTATHNISSTVEQKNMSAIRQDAAGQIKLSGVDSRPFHSSQGNRSINSQFQLDLSKNSKMRQEGNFILEDHGNADQKEERKAPVNAKVPNEGEPLSNEGSVDDEAVEVGAAANKNSPKKRNKP